MSDTPPTIERMVREKIMARSGEERFIMGVQMFDSTREMVKASFPKVCRKRNSGGNCSSGSTGKNLM
jgi:hypothetical protein